MDSKGTSSVGSIVKRWVIDWIWRGRLRHHPWVTDTHVDYGGLLLEQMVRRVYVGARGGDSATTHGG
ncbi:hypothetical protein BDA96_01G360400 [Sorghum bicolor]|uniref:Uncharacterized protein n=2 Tax=Sorghum bicolor TaxID=4558 RepID=A0A921V2D5_SORBI|nr:hypothetical protein BDA96_01G360400 [Sorghum bicolor]KXG39135.1 hypothetical protein SORBI_3001G336800 [Sorghum bicolor]